MYLCHTKVISSNNTFTLLIKLIDYRVVGNFQDLLRKVKQATSFVKVVYENEYKKFIFFVVKGEEGQFSKSNSTGREVSTVSTTRA